MKNQNSGMLVLGASSEIGCEIIRSMDHMNNDIVAHYNSNSKKILAIKEGLSSKIIPVQADLELESDVHRLITEVKGVMPTPEAIVHLPASKFAYTRFKETTWEDYQRELHIAMRSIVMILREFLPAMVKNGGGRIIFVLSSVCIGVPPKNLAPYIASKYALLGLMKSLAAEYADKKVTVNAVSPSMTETDFLTEIPEKLIELAAAGHPLKRNATVKDIAPVVKFLLSADAAYITGVNIPVTGGLAF